MWKVLMAEHFSKAQEADENGQSNAVRCANLNKHKIGMVWSPSKRTPKAREKFKGKF
jgi:hypothetical protein